MTQTALMWPEGQLLAFSALEGESSFSEGIVARTTACGIEIMHPQRLSISLEEAGENSISCGDFFRSGSNRGVFADSYNLLVTGKARVESHPGFTIQNNGNISLVSVSGHENPKFLGSDFESIYSKRAKWLDSLPVPEDLPENMLLLYYKTASIMKTQLYTPEGRIRHRWSTPDRFPHQQMWLWDSVFHAIGWRHLDAPLARDLISAVFDCQAEDGFIPHMMTPQSSSDITQPPILAYGIVKVYEAEADKAWLEELYAPVTRYLAWNCANRDSDGFGLLEWFIEGDPNCRSGESGMDNSSRFDSATQMDAVDFNCFMAKEYDCLCIMANELGKTEDAAKWKEEADILRRKINERLWDNERKFYYDYDVENKRFCDVSAVSGFLPIFCGAVDEPRLERLLELMDDPQHFGTALPLPSVSRSDATFGFDMWRGPSWLNMAWMVAEGLAACGLQPRAGKLRKVWLETIERYRAESGCIFEYYDALAERSPLQLPRKMKIGDFPHQVIRDYGWSATLCMDWCWRSYSK